MRRYEITDQQWAKIGPLLPGQPGSAGRKAADNRLFVNAVLWIARSGAPWRDLPERFGKWTAITGDSGRSAGAVGRKPGYGKKSFRPYKNPTWIG